MDRVIDGVRVGVVLVAALVLGASARPQPPPPQMVGGGPPVAGAQYSPCEHACGQVSRCEIAPYEVCLYECRQRGAEQEPGGPEQLNEVSRTSCEVLEQQYEALMSGGEPAAAQAPPPAAPPAAAPPAVPPPASATATHWVAAPHASYTNAAMVSADIHLDIEVAADGSFRGPWSRYTCIAQAHGVWSCSKNPSEGIASGQLYAGGTGWIELERIGRSTLVWRATSTELTLELPRTWQGEDAMLFRATLKR